MGKTARIQIVDRATGGRGHINVDQIVQTDSKPPGTLRDVTRALTLERRYLHLPVKTGARQSRVAFQVGGGTVREFEIELSDDPGWWAHLDVSPWRGKTGVLRVDRLPEGSRALANVTQADEIWSADSVYREPLRARFHSIVHDAGKREMRVGDLVVPLPRAREKQRLVIYADRTSLEVFADGGLIYVPLPHNFDSENTRVEVKVAEAPIAFDTLEVYELSSAWGSQ